MSDNKNLNNIIFSENQFKFLITKPDLFPIRKFEFIFSNIFYTLISLPFLAILLTLLGFKNYKKKKY